jgi:hypothetical protein
MKEGQFFMIIIKWFWTHKASGLLNTGVKVAEARSWSLPSI